MKRIISAFFILFCLSIFAETKIHTVRNIAVVPLQTIGIDEITKQVTESILLKEIDFQPTLALIPHIKTKEALQGKSCTNSEDAAVLGKAVNADLVLIGSLNKLGAKILVQYILVNVQKEEITLADNLTALEIEDLDMVMKRLAISVDTGLSFNDTAEVGNITLVEEEQPRRRTARYYGGGSFGYLYPQHGFDGDRDESFLADLRSGYEFENSDVGFLIGIRRGIATHVYSSYLFSKQDFCPFVGGLVGFHWISYADDSFKRNTALELGIRTGLLAFRTYDFHVLVNFEYTIAFTEAYDQSLIFTLGIVSNIK